MKCLLSENDDDNIQPESGSGGRQKKAGPDK